MKSGLQSVHTVEVVDREGGPYLFADTHDADRFAAAVLAAGGEVVEGFAPIGYRASTTELIKQETADVEPVPYGVAWPMLSDGTYPPDGWSWVERGDDEDVYPDDEAAADALIAAGIGTEWAYFKRTTHLRLNPPAEPLGPGWSIAVNVPMPTEEVQPMIGAKITITSKLAQAAGEIATQHPESALTIQYDDARAESLWEVIADNIGEGDLVPYLVDDETGEHHRMYRGIVTAVFEVDDYEGIDARIAALPGVSVVHFTGPGDLLQLPDHND